MTPLPQYKSVFLFERYPLQPTNNPVLKILRKFFKIILSKAQVVSYQFKIYYIVYTVYTVYILYVCSRIKLN